MNFAIKSGDFIPTSTWSGDSIIIAGDAIGTPSGYQGARISPPRHLPFRRLYAAAVVLSSVTTGYSPGSTRCTFNLVAESEGKELLAWKFNNDNTTGFAFPGAAGRLQNFCTPRPQFRVSNRLQQQPFMQSWSEPIASDCIEACFRTTATGPMPDAVEWLVTMAPFRFTGPINDVFLSVEGSTSISPDQILLVLGCLSSSYPI